MPEKRKQAEISNELALPSTTNASKRLREESEDESVPLHHDTEVKEKGRSSTTRVFPYTSNKDDIRPFIKLGCLKPNGLTKAFYADGSHSGSGPTSGFAASAVVYFGYDDEDNEVWKYDCAAFDKDTASSFDAELHAIQMAFRIAIEVINEGKEDIENVIIWSDAQNVLRLLVGEATTMETDRPREKRKRALDYIYEKAACLEELGVCVVVAWIKGHVTGEDACEGHTLADQAARRKVREMAKAEDAEEK